MQISDLIVIQGVKIEDLSSEQISRIITSSMLLIEKFTAEGSFQKLKSRLVAGVHLQDRVILPPTTIQKISEEIKNNNNTNYNINNNNNNNTNKNNTNYNIKIIIIIVKVLYISIL